MWFLSWCDLARSSSSLHRIINFFDHIFNQSIYFRSCMMVPCYNEHFALLQWGSDRHIIRNSDACEGVGDVGLEVCVLGIAFRNSYDDILDKSVCVAAYFTASTCSYMSSPEWLRKMECCDTEFPSYTKFPHMSLLDDWYDTESLFVTSKHSRLSRRFPPARLACLVLDLPCVNQSKSTIRIADNVTISPSL